MFERQLQSRERKENELTVGANSLGAARATKNQASSTLDAGILGILLRL